MKNGMITQEDMNASVKSLFSQDRDKSSNSNTLHLTNPKNTFTNGFKPIFNTQEPRPKPTPKPNNPPLPIKITEKTKTNLQWVTLIMFFATLGYAFISFDFTSINSVLSSSALIPVILGAVAVFFLWQFTSDQLSQFPLEIVDDKPHGQMYKQIHKHINLIKQVSKPSPASNTSVSDLQDKIYKTSQTTLPIPPQQPHHDGRTLDKTSLMVITMGIIFIFMLCIWAIDTSVTALRLEASGLAANLDNGWMLQNPALIYHLALYTMILLVAVLAIVAMLNLVRRTDIPWLPLFKAKPKTHLIPLAAPSGNGVLFSMIGYTASMAFTVMIMIFLAVSWTGTKGLTIIHWNHFGEHNIETLIFIVAFVVISIGFYFTFKNFRETVSTRRLNRVK